MFDDNTIYVVGHGKTSSDNAITINFTIFFIGFVINIDTDEIVDLDCSATVDITRKFVRSMFLGKSFKAYDEEIINEIKRRYFGSSQKAIMTAYKDAIKKYISVKKEYYK